jgi:hypothetical protein
VYFLLHFLKVGVPVKMGRKYPLRMQESAFFLLHKNINGITSKKQCIAWSGPPQTPFHSLIIPLGSLHELGLPQNNLEIFK